MTALDNGQLIVVEGVEDLVALLRWRDTHKEQVRGFRPMVREGIIEYGEGGLYRQEFRFITDDVIRHEYLAGGVLKGFGFEYDRRTWKAENVRGMLTFYPVDLAIQDMITVHATVMAILQHAPGYVKWDNNRMVIKVT